MIQGVWFCIGISLFHLLKRLFFFHLISLAPHSKINCPYFFSRLSAHESICLYLHQYHCFDYYSYNNFQKHLDSVKSSLFIKIVLVILDLHFHMNFKTSLNLTFYKLPAGILIGIVLNLHFQREVTILNLPILEHNSSSFTYVFLNFFLSNIL